MAPTLHDGDTVLIDMARPSSNPPGIFVLHDGMGLVAKRLEHVPNSDPPRVRIISDNPLYAPYDGVAEQINIVGRVRWFARELLKDRIPGDRRFRSGAGVLTDGRCDREDLWLHCEIGAIGLTASKAFKSSFVHFAADEFNWPSYSEYELFSVKEVLNEGDFPPLTDIHDLLVALKKGGITPVAVAA